jgi:hypothetical protein
MTDDLREYLQRDQHGTSEPWRHCNLCPIADHLPCIRSCAGQRRAAQDADGIEVTYP